MTFDGTPEGWLTTTLGDIAVDAGLVGGPFGSSLGRKDYVENGVPVIRGTNIAGESKFNDNGLVFVTEEKVENDLRRNTAVAGDILLTQRGTLGQVGVVPQNSYPIWVISQSQERLRVDQTQANRDFIYFVLRSPTLIDEIRRRAITTGVPHINLGITQELPIPLPPLDEQERIAGFLGTLDNKIDNNRRLANTLEEIATVLFKARYIEFLGCDDLVESEIGPIPRGWSHTSVGDLARYVNGKAFTKFGNGQGRMVIRIAELRSGPGESTVYSDHEAGPDFMAAPGDILFAWSGSLDVYRWHRPEALINQHIFKLIPKGYPDWFVFHALKYIMPHFQAIAADKATTMGHIKRADLHAFSVATPPTSALKEHDAVFSPLFERAFAARRKAETLAQVRDQFLPRLISGQIRIPAEEQLRPEVA